jgi:hypothetical protein
MVTTDTRRLIAIGHTLTTSRQEMVTIPTIGGGRQEEAHRRTLIAAHQGRLGPAIRLLLAGQTYRHLE